MPAPKFEIRFDETVADPLEGLVIVAPAPAAAPRDDDPLGLDEIIRAALDKREWIEDSAVALIHEQECDCCGTVSSFSMGWFTGKHHARDKTARQLIAGKPVGYFPHRVERVRCPNIAVCAACAESQAIIENICAPAAAP